VVGSRASCPRIGKTKFGKNYCGGPGGIIPPGGGLEAAAHKVLLLTLILTLIFILLPPKGGLGAQPQGFDFVSLPEGHYVQSWFDEFVYSVIDGLGVGGKDVFFVWIPTATKKKKQQSRKGCQEQEQTVDQKHGTEGSHQRSR